MDKSKFRKNLILEGAMLYGNERWTVNLVTARRTRGRAPPAIQKIWNFQKNLITFQLFEKFRPDRALKFEIIFRNYFFMARRMCVQPSLLVRLATATSGKPSTKFPLGNSKGRSLSRDHFPENSKLSKKNSLIFNFLGKFRMDRTLKFQCHFTL